MNFFIFKKNSLVVILIVFFILLFNLSVVNAQNYVPLAPLPGMPAGESVDIESYLGIMFKIGIGLAGVFAVLMIVISGIQFIGGASSPSARTEANERITNAILGLILALGSWLILNTVNPALLQTKLEIEPVTITGDSPVGYVGYILSTELSLTQNFEDIDKKLIELEGLASLTPEQEKIKADLLLERQVVKEELEEILDTKAALREELVENVRCQQYYEPTTLWCSGDGYTVNDIYCDGEGRKCCAYKAPGCDNTPD